MKECTVKKPLPLLIGFGMGCCHTCLPLHPCSISFIHAHPRPRSYALYAPAFALVYVPALTPVCMRLHTCSFIRACTCTHSYTPVFVLICTCLYVPAFVPIRKCLRSCPFVRAWIRPHPRPPCLSVPAVALVRPCHPRSYMMRVRASSLSLACVCPVLSSCLWNFTVKV